MFNSYVSLPEGIVFSDRWFNFFIGPLGCFPWSHRPVQLLSKDHTAQQTRLDFSYAKILVVMSTVHLFTLVHLSHDQIILIHIDAILILQCIRNMCQYVIGIHVYHWSTSFGWRMQETGCPFNPPAYSQFWLSAMSAMVRVHDLLFLQRNPSHDWTGWPGAIWPSHVTGHNLTTKKEAWYLKVYGTYWDTPIPSKTWWFSL